MRKKIVLFLTTFLLSTALIAGITLSVKAAGDAGDANVGEFSQCANDDGDGYGGNPGTCNWTNGDLQKNNSTYTEGDAVVHRLWLTGLTPGTHTVEITYQTTKGGKHAYDYLMSWNYSEGWIPLANLCAGITGCTGWAQSTYPIPTDPNAVNQIAGNMTIFNGTITGMSGYTVNGPYTGDSDTSITITFNTTSTQVFLVWGGHIASVLDWGAGNSASNISGAPYHMKITKFDERAIGNRDNQVMASALVPPAQLTIIKDAIPDYQRVFTYTATTTAPTPLNPNPFYLQDYITGTIPNTITFPGLLDGSYTITESIAPGTSWLLVEVNCTAIKRSTSTPITPVTYVDLDKDTLNVNLTLDEAVTCTFVNQGGMTAVQLSSFSGNSENGFSLIWIILAAAGLVASGLWLIKSRNAKVSQ